MLFLIENGLKWIGSIKDDVEKVYGFQRRVSWDGVVRNTSVYLNIEQVKVALRKE